MEKGLKVLLVASESAPFQRFWDECRSKWLILYGIRWIVRRTVLGLTKTGNFRKTLISLVTFIALPER